MSFDQHIIAAARQEALSVRFETYEANSQSYDTAVHDFVVGAIGGDELTRRVKELDLPHSAYIDTVSAEDFRAALLGLGIAPEEVDNVVTHEQVHFDIDHKNGLAPVFRIQLTTDSHGVGHWHPMVWAMDDLNAIGNRERFTESIAAPDDQSTSDRRKLGREI